MLKKILMILFLLPVMPAFSQYDEIVDSLKKVEQDCLDKGWRMPACVYQLYADIDSLLNVVYNKLQSTLPADKKATLKQEQREWLKKRDAYFKKKDREYEDSLRSGDWGPEMRVVPLSDKESFIEDRFWVLVETLQSALVMHGLQSVDSLLTKIFNANSPGIGIGIVSNGKTVFNKGYGLANINTKHSISSSSNFNIASLTKQFTAMAILQLDEKNKLSLADTLSKYLPALNKNVAGKITIQQLLSHSSGLIDHYDYVDTKNLQHAHNIDVFNAIKNIDSTYFTPGTQFRYSNTAYCLLALIIEKVSGMRYNDYMKQHIFLPAGMLHTTIWNEDETITNPATGYALNSATKYFKKNQAEEHIFFSTEGDGGIYTSVNDYIKWFQALQERKVFSPEIVHKARSIYFEIDKARQLGYGFGWFVDARTPAKAYHSGDNSGFRTFTFTIPGENFLIVIFANREDVNIEELVQKIYLILRPGEKPFINVEVLTS